MKIFSGLIAALILTGSASAQTVTTCSGYNIVTCYNHDPHNSYGGSDKSAAENIVSLFRGDPKRKAGKLLAKGDCNGAIKHALKSGDIDFATQVRDYCAGQ